MICTVSDEGHCTKPPADGMRPVASTTALTARAGAAQKHSPAPAQTQWAWMLCSFTSLPQRWVSVCIQSVICRRRTHELVGLLGTPGYEARARLPGETVLSQRLGVSRPVLRQALARLRDEGRIHTRKGSGNFVAEVMPQGERLSFGTLSNIPDIRAFWNFAAAWRAKPLPAPPKCARMRKWPTSATAANALRPHCTRGKTPWKRTSPSTKPFPWPVATASSA